MSVEGSNTAPEAQPGTPQSRLTEPVRSFSSFLDAIPLRNRPSQSQQQTTEESSTREAAEESEEDVDCPDPGQDPGQDPGHVPSPQLPWTGDEQQLVLYNAQMSTDALFPHPQLGRPPTARTLPSPLSTTEIPPPLPPRTDRGDVESDHIFQPSPVSPLMLSQRAPWTRTLRAMLETRDEAEDQRTSPEVESAEECFIAGVAVKAFQLLDDLVAENECAICRQIFRNPHIFRCGHSFCVLCIERWVNASQIRPSNPNVLQLNGSRTTCPTCRHPLTPDFQAPYVKCIPVHGFHNHLEHLELWRDELRSDARWNKRQTNAHHTDLTLILPLGITLCRKHDELVTPRESSRVSKHQFQVSLGLLADSRCLMIIGALVMWWLWVRFYHRLVTIWLAQ